jgi:hypothetical protein
MLMVALVEQNKLAIIIWFSTNLQLVSKRSLIKSLMAMPMQKYFL